MGFPLLQPADTEPTSFATIDAERLHRRKQTAIGYRILGSYGWGSTGDGHVSARDPERHDHFWMARYGVPFNQVTLNDIVLVGPAGTVVDAPGGIDTGINMAAYNIHWPLHEARADVVSACHTHTPYGTPFATKRELLRPITQESCSFFERHSIFDDEELEVVSTDAGKRIAAALGDNLAVILANHGLLTTGGSVAEAVGWFIIMERVAESHVKAGDSAKPISNEGARIVRNTNGTSDFGWHPFQYLARRVITEADSWAFD
jgi:ribulose-5-phosphate 4-epimerase/fuculose-1-phosphate aldolase